jgi:hypothetical protein
MKLPALRFRLWTLFLAIALLAGGLAVVRRLERKVALNNELRGLFEVYLEDDQIAPDEWYIRPPSVRRDVLFDVVEMHEIPGEIDVPRARRALARIGSFRSLRRIELPSIPIDESLLETLQQLPELRELTIGPGSSDRQIRSCLESLSQLTSLDLSYSQMSDETGASLSHLTDLETLELSQTQVAHRTARVLGQLPHLKRVSLDGCHKLSGQSIAELAHSQSLETIVLWDTPCDDDALLTLAAIPTLQMVSLHEATPTTSLGVARFKLLRPDVKVLWLDR